MTLILPSLWFFLLGAAMGSFYNVLIDRLPEGRDVIRVRSSCSSCGTKLKIWDLIPIFSFLFLGGRCRYCKAKLSPWYLISELTVGTLFVGAFHLFAQNGNVLSLIAFLVLWSLLFIVAVMDWETGMIMDLFSLLIAVSGLVFSLLARRSIWQILLGAAAGFALYGLVYVIARWVFKREGLGFGDVLLLGAIGFWLPWDQMIVTAFLTAYVSIIFIVILAIRDKKVGMKTEMPLGPSICLATFLMNIFGERIMTFLLRILFA